MPEDPLTEAEILATLDALGELSGEDEERLRRALAENPELAEEHARLRDLSASLTDSALPLAAASSDEAIPAELLASLEQNRAEALRDEAQSENESPKKVIPFPGGFSIPVWFAAAAALVLLAALVRVFLPGEDSTGPKLQPVFAMHTEALDLARNYTVLQSKSIGGDPILPSYHDQLVAHLRYLEEAGQTGKGLEILDALPATAQELEMFQQLRQQFTPPESLPR